MWDDTEVIDYDEVNKLQDVYSDESDFEDDDNITHEEQWFMSGYNDAGEQS